jgi:MFS family permease
MPQRLFALVAAVVLVDTMFYAAIAPLLPHYVDTLDLSKTAAGVLSASYAAGTLIGALPSGWVAARAGVKATMLGGLSLMSATSIAFAFGGSIQVLDAARFLQGIGGALSWTGGLAWLMAAAPRNRRGTLLGSAMAAAIGGVLLGPVLGGAAAEIGPEPVFSLVAVLGVGLATWTLTMPGGAPSERPQLGQVASAITSRPVLTGAWLVAVAALFAGAIDVLVPLRLDVLGASGAAIGAIFLASAAAEGVTSRALGGVSDRRGRLVPIRMGLVFSGVMAMLIPLPEVVATMALALMLAVVALGFLWAPSMALLSDAAETTGLDQGFALALTSFAWAGGQVIGGSVGASIADATSDAVPYLIVAALFALTWLGLNERFRPSPVRAR